MASRAIFRDPVTERAFDRDGYVVIPLLGEGEVAELRRAYQDLTAFDFEGFHVTLFSRSAAYRRAVSEATRGVVEPPARRHLLDYRTINGQFVAKKPGRASLFDFHLDWSFVDERVARSVAIWCPLQPVGRENGGLWVVPGSHRLDYTLRGNGPGPEFWCHTSRPFWAVAHRRYTALPLALPAGHAVFYDHRLIHGSPPNLSPDLRLVVVQAMVPEEGPARFLHRTSDSVIDVYAPDADFYCRYQIGGQPEGAEHAGRLEVSPNYLRPQDLRQLLQGVDF